MEEKKNLDEELTGKKEAENQAQQLAAAMATKAQKPKQVVEVDYQEGLMMAGS